MSHRVNINTMSGAKRQALVNLMLLYITGALVADHMNIIHTDSEDKITGEVSIHSFIVCS